MRYLFLARLSVLGDLLPDAVDISDLVGEKQLIRETSHNRRDLDITCREEHFYALADFCFSFREVIVELLDELLRLFERLDVPLPPTVALVLQHHFALLRTVHLQVETYKPN